MHELTELIRQDMKPALGDYRARSDRLCGGCSQTAYEVRSTRA